MKPYLLLILCVATSTVHAQSTILENWNYTFGGDVFSSPALAPDGTVFIGSNDTYLHAVNPDGTLKGSFKTGDWVDSTPTIVAGANDEDYSIIFGSWDNFVYALNSAGQQLWAYETGSSIISSPVVHGGIVVACSIDGYCYGVNLNDGSHAWEYLVDAEIQSSPVVDENGVVYLAARDNTVHAINSQTGIGSWSTNLSNLFPLFKPESQDRVTAGLTLVEGNLLLIGSGDGVLYALDTSAGTQEWYFEATAEIDNQPVVDQLGNVYFGSRDGYLYCINTTGIFQWAIELGEIYYSSPAIGRDGNVYALGYSGSSTTSLYKLDSTGFNVETVLISGVNDASPLITPDGYMYIAMLDGKLYQYDISESLMESDCPQFRQTPARAANLDAYRTPFHQWVTDAFGEAALETLQSDDDSDLDRVGLLAEFKLGMDPTQADAQPFSVQVDSVDVTFGARARLAAQDVIVAALVSNELTDIDPEEVQPSVISVEDGFQNLEVTTEHGGNSTFFGRFIFREY
ncbi:MAG: PQQ-binding-like beta-propeller repeat protein [Opitutaceae bacterium]